MSIFKKLLPFQKSPDKPLHSGEIYFLWDGLTSGYKLLQVLETFLMNTEDKEIQILLQGMIKGININRIQRLERILKEEGFTAPPRPATKLKQGKPGVGQEVKLNDDELLLNLIAWGETFLQHDSKALVASIRDQVRKTFTDLLFDEIKAYSVLKDFANNRNVIINPPPATSKDNSLNMGKVGLLWAALRLRLISISSLEQYLAGTTDKKLISLLKEGINEVVYPQLEQIENLLKKEGFTVPARPERRTDQAPPGKANKIKLSDNEVIDVLTVAFQTAIIHHVRGFFSAVRKDVRDLFMQFLKIEIAKYEKLLALAKSRHTLDNPPVVTSRNG